MATTVRGHVTNGRLVVDVPTEGSEVELVTVRDAGEIPSIALRPHSP